MKIKTLLFALTLFFSAFLCEAQIPEYKNEFGFRSENDSYLAYGQDRYYTNGLSIYFRRATDQSKLGEKLNKITWEAEVGQKMYNPQSGNITDISYVDRPFAGYLYAGAGVNLLFNSENSLKFNLQVGTIGPDAKGKEAQELLHNTVGFYEVAGWQWQVNNEVGVNASVDYKHFIHRSGSRVIDFSADSYVHIGNTFAGAGLGILFRAGDLKQFFNSASTESLVSNRGNSKELEEREFFFYAKPMVHYVAYDASIQGGLFRKDKGPVTFDAKPIVFSQQAGLIYAKNRWTIDFSVIFKSKEVESVAKAHQYGSAALSYRFN